MRNAGALQDQTLTDMGDDIAAERPARRLAEGDNRRQSPREIFVDDGGQPILDMHAKRFASFHLMAGNANVHGRYSSCCYWGI
jgi:hypothetical protein